MLLAWVAAIRRRFVEPAGVYVMVSDPGQDITEAIGPFPDRDAATEFDIDQVDTLFVNPILDVRKAVTPQEYLARSR